MQGEEFRGLIWAPVDMAAVEKKVCLSALIDWQQHINVFIDVPK